MKIQVNVDLSELFIDEDEAGVSLQTSIQNSVIHTVKQQVMELLKKDATDKISALAVSAIEEQKEVVIADIVHKAIHEQKVKKAYSGSGEMLTYAQYMQESLERTYLQENQISRKIDDSVKQIGTEIAAELKKRYDLLFASQIVTRLNQQGMLREDVARILLGDNPASPAKS